MVDQTAISPPPMPEGFSIPQGMLDQWFAHSTGDYLDVGFTRGDWDTLFSSLNNSLQSQTALDQALVDWSNGNTAAANGWLNESRRLRIESGNSLRRFFMQIMSSASRIASQ